MKPGAWDDLPRASHPPSRSTILVNSLEPTEFPFKRLSAWPRFSYAIENLIVSVATLFVSLADCLLTLYVWTPLGLIHSFLHHVVHPFLEVIRSQPEHQRLNRPRGKVIVISGASSGIGASLVRLYAEPENVLILLARNPSRLNQVAKLARGAGSKAVEIHSIDYSHEGAENSIKQAIQGAHRKYGSIDIVFSVAGTVTFTDDDPHGPEPWGANTAKRLTKVNLASTYTFIMTAWELMKDQRGGKICIISSSSAFYAPPQFALYSAAKANLLSFSQSLRSLSSPYGIQVSCICPGFIESGMASDMLAAGSTMPAFMLAKTTHMAERIKKAVDEEQPVAIWPINQVLPLVMASRLNYLNSDFFRWVSSKIGITGRMVS